MKFAGSRSYSPDTGEVADANNVSEAGLNVPGTAPLSRYNCTLAMSAVLSPENCTNASLKVSLTPAGLTWTVKLRIATF